MVEEPAFPASRGVVPSSPEASRSPTTPAGLTEHYDHPDLPLTALGAPGRPSAPYAGGCAVMAELSALDLCVCWIAAMSISRLAQDLPLHPGEFRLEVYV